MKRIISLIVLLFFISVPSLAGDYDYYGYGSSAVKYPHTNPDLVTDGGFAAVTEGAEITSGALTEGLCYRRYAAGQAVTITASAAASIVVGDDPDLDFGAGDFSGAVLLNLADYTPAAEIVLEQKTDGTNGRDFTLQTDGKLRLTINITDYDSTAATGATDGTKHLFGYAVTRETAAADGEIIFTADGVALGTAVVITAGAPTTVDNAVSQYVMGTSAARTAGTVFAYYSYNRAVTTAQMLAHYNNGGPVAADQWGSQTAKNSADCSNMAGRGYDTFDGESATGFHVVKTTAAGYDAVITNPTIPGAAVSKQFLVTFTATLTSGAAPGIRITKEASAISTASNFDTVVAGANSHLLTITSVGAVAHVVFLTPDGEVAEYTIADLNIVQAGATLSLDQSDMNLADWTDSSTNSNDAAWPADGYTLHLASYFNSDGTEPVFVFPITFDSWTVGTGWAPQATAGALTNKAQKIAGVASDLEQNVSAAAIKAYEIVWTNDQSTAGKSINTEIGGVNGTAITVDATTTETIKTTGTGNLKFEAAIDWAGTVDTISTKRVYY